MLICPNCKNKLSQEDRVYKCINKHSFDIAKEGYLNLLLNKSNSGDNFTMVKSRQIFLEKNYFLTLLNHIIHELEDLNLQNPNILDLGCGNGYYTSAIARKYNNVIGLDISKEAIKLASKGNNSINYLVASAKDLPLATNSIDIILNVFAPLFIKEAYRVLKDNGVLIKVTPNKNHLLELKEILYDTVYLTTKKNDYFGLELKKSHNLSYQINTDIDDLLMLLKMTPYIYKTSFNNLNKLKNVDNLNITLDFNILIYIKSI